MAQSLDTTGLDSKVTHAWLYWLLRYYFSNKESACN